MTDQRLIDAWEQRNKLYAEGDKLWVEARKFWAEGTDLHAEGKCSKLWVEARKFWAEGNRLFRNAVTAVHGKDVVITWTYDGCELSTGEVFRNEEG